MAKQNIDKIIINNFAEATDFRELGNSFNHTFVSTVPGWRNEINDDNTTTGETITNLNSVYLPLMLDRDLKEMILNMPLLKSAGYDRVRRRDFYCNFDRFNGVLLSIPNGIFENGTLPGGMKLSIFRRVWNNESKNELKNYRPLSIVPAITHIS